MEVTDATRIAQLEARCKKLETTLVLDHNDRPTRLWALIQERDKLADEKLAFANKVAEEARAHGETKAQLAAALQEIEQLRKGNGKTSDS